jgi:hypothetical protein
VTRRQFILPSLSTLRLLKLLYPHHRRRPHRQIERVEGTTLGIDQVGYGEDGGTIFGSDDEDDTMDSGVHCRDERVKMGRSVLSWIKNLGGMASSVAKARAGCTAESTPLLASPSTNNPTHSYAAFFSRSDPASSAYPCSFSASSQSHDFIIMPRMTLMLNSKSIETLLSLLLWCRLKCIQVYTCHRLGTAT